MSVPSSFVEDAPESFVEDGAPESFVEDADQPIQRGNIDLNNRPRVSNPDGSYSTVRSISVGTDNGVFLIPTVIGNKVVSNDEAIKHWRQTGEHLGQFATEDAANAYAQTLHENQAEAYRHAPPLQLNPLQTAQLQTGLVNPSSERNQGEAISPQELEAVRAVQQAPSQVLGYAGNVARAIPADIAAGVAGQTRFAGNVPAAVTGGDLPIDEALKLASKQSQDEGKFPTAAVTGKISQGLAASAPTLAALAVAPGNAQAAIGAYFTGEQLLQAKKVFSDLGAELGKPEKDQDPDKLSSLYSEATQLVAFTGLGALPVAGIGRNVALTKGDALRISARDLMDQVSGTELAPTYPKAKRELGIQPINTEPFLQPGVPELAGEALRQNQNIVQTPQSGQVLQALRGAVGGIAPAVAPEHTLKPEIQGGQISFSGEAGGIPNARQSAVKPLGGQDARTIPSTESVPEPEVRPPVGESAPLRQPGEAASPQGAGGEIAPAENGEVKYPPTSDFQREAIAKGTPLEKNPEFVDYQDTYVLDPSKIPNGAVPLESMDGYQVKQPDGTWKTTFMDLDGRIKTVPSEAPVAAQKPPIELTPSEFYDWSQGKDLNAEQDKLAKELPEEKIYEARSRARQEADELKAKVTDAASADAFSDAANKLQFWNETLAKSKSQPTKINAGARSVETPATSEDAGKLGLENIAAKAGVDATKAVEAWGKHSVEVVEPLKQKVKKLEQEVQDMAADGRRANPEYKGKDKTTVKNLLAKYGVSSKDELNALYKQKNNAWADEASRLVGENMTLKELAAVKDRRGQEWSRAVAKAKEAKAAQQPPANLPPSASMGEQKVRVGKSPQLHTILRETTDPKFPDEKIFEVQNDRTGEKFEVDANSMEPVTERPKEANQPKRDLDAELRAAKLDPSVFPDKASKQAALKRQKGLIENIESLQARIRGRGAELKMGVPAAILDTALEIARLALVAGRSVKDAVDAAIKHIRENHTGDFREMEARRTLMAELERPVVERQTGEQTAPAATQRAATPATGETLKDIYKIFEPSPKTPFSAKKAAVNIIEAVRTGLGSKFRPLNKLAEDIGKAYGLTRPKDIAGIFEQLKGSQGKGEAEVYRFDRDVSSLVKGNEKEFNAYMFLRRGLDRLNQDAADIAREQAEPGSVGALNRRSVSDYTIPQLESKLALLSRELGPEKLAKFRDAADKYQSYMDNALRLQVESGRMSPEVYDAIKNGNQFYAPFKVMKYLEETSRPEGVGSKIDTMADFTKAMTGIKDSDFKLGDMLGAARQSILISRILADKNMAMRKISELAPFDPQGLFIKRISAGMDAPRGMEIVNVLEGGKQKRYAVSPDVAEALQIYGGTAGGILSRVLSLASVPFRAGATALNIPFQVSNLMADVPRQALISKYGIRGVEDLVKYPLDFIQSLYSSMSGDLLGRENKLFQDFLDSGVAGTTVQEYLTPEALKFHEPSTISRSKALARSVLTVLPRFAEAIEQTTKILGVKRAMRFEGVGSGKELSKQIPEAITELRRYSGSPDFGRQGKWIESLRLNLLYMFLNARIQGMTADVGRLGGKDGPKTTAVTWARLMAAVGIPTVYLYALNSRPENKQDYEKRSVQERQNYWLIPKTDGEGKPRYVTTEDGEKIRDYWRIPKRESSKWIANYAEAALDFSEKRDKKAFGDFANSMIQELSPVNISGENATEKMESVGSGLNPIIKAPLELATGRDLYRHRDIMSDQLKKASPEQQYNDRTAEAFKTIADKIPDVAPEFLRSPIILENLTRNLTAGLATQFLPRKPVSGRSDLENQPLLQRFQSLPYSDQQEFRDQMTQLERNAADEQLIRHRAAVKLLDENKDKPLQDYAAKAGDVKTLKTLVDLYVAKQNGATAADRQLLALPVHQRAMYVLHTIDGLPQDKKNQTILDLARKRILTESVLNEMGTILKDK